MSLRSNDMAERLIKHVLYPLWALKNRSPRLRYVRELEASQYLPQQTLLDRQWALFREMLAHAYATCPYYKRKLDAAGVAPADVVRPEDIRRVPILTKEDVQENADEMISSLFDKRLLIRDMTGGSTGSPMVFYYDEDRLDSRVAAAIRHNRWAGWDIGSRAAILWGAPRDMQSSRKLWPRLRNWILDRSMILDASALDDAAMDKFARELQRYRPTVLLAYANTLGLFARYVEANGITGIRPHGIVCSAEVLTDENRKLIEKVFGCPVYNRYGSREFSVIASECEAHRGMHINAENLLVEVLEDEKDAAAPGEIVVTDLRNRAMPLIRYRTRDVGRMLEGVCSCGRGLPLLDLAGGRVTDFLVATNGRKVSGIVIATYVITNIPGVRQVQFRQDEPKALLVNLVKGPAWSDEAQRQLFGKLREFLGADMELRIEFKEEIPREVSGKYRFSISTVGA
jgi:phenylacetate-CoA ligase